MSSPSVSPSKGTTTFRGGWTLSRVIEVVKEATEKSIPQVRRLAMQLKTGNLVTDARKVYQWIDREIRYQKDPAGEEDVKTASRTVSDGYGDCEDMTILAVALLQNMGHRSARAAIIAQHDPRAPWSHIFAVVGHKARPSNEPQGYIIDPVPPLTGFDQAATQISRLMNVNLLEGVSSIDGVDPDHDSDFVIAGYGPAIAPTPFTVKMLDQQSTILSGLSGLSGEAVPGAGQHLRKLHALIMCNGLPEQTTLSAIMPYVEDVDQGGTLVFRNDAPFEALAEYLELEGNALEGISGIGSLRQRLARIKALREKAKAQRQARRANKQPSRFAQAIKKVAKAAVRFNPATIAIRNGLLLALKLNLFKLSERLIFAYMTGSAARNLDQSELRNLKDQRRRLEVTFKKLGGSQASLERAIRSGAARAARKKERRNLRGIGAAAAAAGTAAASGIIAKITGMLKKVNFKKLLSKVKPEKVADLVLKKAGSAANDPDLLPGANIKILPGYKNNQERETARNVSVRNSPKYKRILEQQKRQGQAETLPQDTDDTGNRSTDDDDKGGSGSGAIIGGLLLVGILFFSQQ